MNEGLRFALLASGMAALACGGSIPGGGGSGDGGSERDTASGSSSGLTGSSSGSSSGGSTSSSGASSGSGSSSGGSSGSSSGVSAGGSIACGTAMCNTATSVCCVTIDGDGGTGFTSTCEPAAQCTTAKGIGLQCGATADCPTGEVCCLWWNGAPKSSSCGNFQTATSNCYGGGTQLCDPNDSCSLGRTCKPDADGGTLPMNYWTCQ